MTFCDIIIIIIIIIIGITNYEGRHTDTCRMYIVRRDRLFIVIVHPPKL